MDNYPEKNLAIAKLIYQKLNGSLQQVHLPIYHITITCDNIAVTMQLHSLLTVKELADIVSAHLENQIPELCKMKV